jgi:hypothetical protein
MPALRRFAPKVLEALRNGKYVWIRAGEEHRFIAIWAVVVEGRLFVRSWNAKPRGWHQAFLEDKRGAIRLAKDGEEIAVRPVQTRSERLKAAVDRGFVEKYTTASSLKYVKGFRLPKRRDTTIELVPSIMRR